MMNVDQIIANFVAQDNSLSRRVIKALEYRNAVAHGDVTPEEYQELVRDLQRLDNIELSAAELDQQIAFKECMNILMQLPL